MAMPRTRARVVCTFWVTAATLAPTKVLTRVDLPALGAPSTATTEQRCSDIDALLFQECACGRALRLALRFACAALGNKPLDARLDDEMRRMIGARLFDHRISEFALFGRRPFLQRGLGVAGA